MELVLSCIIYLPDELLQFPKLLFAFNAPKLSIYRNQVWMLCYHFLGWLVFFFISLSGWMKLKDVMCSSILALLMTLSGYSPCICACQGNCAPFQVFGPYLHLILGRNLLKMIPEPAWPDKLFLPLIFCKKFIFYWSFSFVLVMNTFLFLLIYFIIFVPYPLWCFFAIYLFFFLPLTLLFLESNFLAADDQVLTVSISPLV